MKNLFLVQVISLLLLTNLTSASEKDLLRILPENREIKQAVPSGEPQVAKGEKLFELINGGAVLFFKHGFQQTLFQEYQIDNGRIMNLEIYQMDTPAGAKGVFTERADPSAKQIPLGEQGLQGDYYCAFHRGVYYVTVTGSAFTKEIQQILLTTAKMVDKKIRDD